MSDRTIADFVAALAARTPTPGGGSAAACAAAMGIALLTMAARFATGKKHDAADASSRLEHAIAVLDEKRERLLPMIERDATAFEHVAAGYRLPKATAEQQRVRERAIQEALRGAMAVPEEVMCLARDALATFGGVVELIGRNIVSDVGAGTALLEAAAEIGRLNVRINVSYLQDRALAEAALARVTAVHEEIARCAKRNHEVVAGLLHA